MEAPHLLHEGAALFCNATPGLSVKPAPSALTSVQEPLDFETSDWISSMLASSPDSWPASLYEPLLPEPLAQQSRPLQAQDYEPLQIPAHFIYPPLAWGAPESPSSPAHPPPLLNAPQDASAAFQESHLGEPHCKEPLPDRVARQFYQNSQLASPADEAFLQTKSFPIGAAPSGPQRRPTICLNALLQALDGNPSTLPVPHYAARHVTHVPDFKEKMCPVPVSPVRSSITPASIADTNTSVDDAETAQILLMREFYKHLDKSVWRRRACPQQGGNSKRDKCSGVREHWKQSRVTKPGFGNGNSVRPLIKLVDLSKSTGDKFPPKVIFRVKTDNLKLEDGFEWRKYGEKEIKGHTFTRNYLKCEKSKETGCKAQKHIQRWTEDHEFVEFAYFGKHNHPPQHI